MAMTPQEYDKMLKESSPPTRSGRTLPVAFAVGGFICVVGQALTDCYRRTISETEWQKYVQFYCPDGTKYC